MNSRDTLLASVLTAIGVAVLFAIYWRIKRRHIKAGSVSKLESALRDERIKSGIILNAIEDGVVLYDDHGIIRSFNPGAANITGWKDTEAMNLDINTVMKLVDAKGQTHTAADNPLQQVFAQKTAVRCNTSDLVTQAGKRLSLSLSISPLSDDNGRVFGAVATFRDVTDERAEESQRAEFISTASHEMRTPVAAIEGYLSLSLNDKVATIDSRARDYLQKAHLSTEHLGKLFQDLLTSAKAEDGRLTSHPIVTEMGQYLNQVSNDLRFAADKKGLGVEFASGNSGIINAEAGNDAKTLQPLYYVRADPDRLREVVTNLFDNAVKYTDTGKIIIGLTGNDQVVQIYIRDTGPGIAAEDAPHLFQKFYRVDNSATRTIGGTGLGLFICRKIVELYGGRIWVESRIGQGSTFYINLPRLSTAAATAQTSADSNQVGGNLPAITSLASV